MVAEVGLEPAVNASSAPSGARGEGSDPRNCVSGRGESHRTLTPPWAFPPTKPVLFLFTFSSVSFSKDKTHNAQVPACPHTHTAVTLRGLPARASSFWKDLQVTLAEDQPSEAG